MIHQCLQLIYQRESARFYQALNEPEQVQRTILKRILVQVAQSDYGRDFDLSSVHSYEDFCLRFSITDYENWRPLIQRQMATQMPILNQKVARYEPTSGSTGQRKWIPYTPNFLTEINCAAQTWIQDIYKTYPGTRSGKHFWSLSWLPTELRGQINTDDSTLFPWWQQAILGKIITRHPAIQYAPSGKAAWWATKLHLASTSDLSLLSVWSPTFALNLIQELFEERQLVANALTTGTWLEFTEHLKNFKAPRRTDIPKDANTPRDFVRRLWPKLSLVSAWGAASSKSYATELQDLIGSIPFQEKGIWATEGVVTFPFQGRHPIAVRSHFYEFLCLSTGQILPTWKLELGQELQPILTAGNSFLRYRLNDRVRVTGFLGKTPCLEFLGRLGGLDLVGEKISFQKADEVLTSLRNRLSNIDLYFIGAKIEQSQAQYYAIGVGPAFDEAALADALETEMLGIHHYACARELGQLKPAGAKLYSSKSEINVLMDQHAIKGQSKPNSIILMS